MDAYRLKWIAIVGMFFNHAVLALREVIPLGLALPMFAVGGVTFPIMAFMVVEGYKHTSNLRRYLLRIFAFGLIAQIPYMLAVRDFFRLNIMFTILLGLLLILLYDRLKNSSIKHVVFWPVFILGVAVSAVFDWMIIGVIMMFLFHAISNEGKRRAIPPFVAGMMYVLSLSFAVLGYMALGDGFVLGAYSAAGSDVLFFTSFPVGIFFAIYLLKKYNGERGRRMKYLFYWFYPLHFVALAAAALGLGLIELPMI